MQISMTENGEPYMNAIAERSTTRAAVLFAIVFLCHTSAFAQFRSDGCGCPKPNGDSAGGRVIPGRADHFQQLTRDGKKLVYWLAGASGIAVLDLATLSESRITIAPRLPRQQDLGFGRPFLCPYDPDVIAFTANSDIDTSVSGGHPFSVRNLYKYRISSGVATRITPDTAGPLGSSGVQLLDWLPGSTALSDSLLIDLVIPKVPYFYGVYVPQSRSYLSWRKGTQAPTDPIISARSISGRHEVVIVNDTTLPPTGKQWYYLDHTEIVGPRVIQSLRYASFSPNGSLLALTVDPDGTGPSSPDGTFTDTVFTQVWIFSAESAAPKNVRVINFQCFYCKYNFWGADAEFITDSTLAVSMHADGDSVSPLWEIALDGRIIRQLTFLPQQGVKSQLPSYGLRVWPSVADRTVAITWPKGYLVKEISIVNDIGGVVSLLPVPVGANETKLATEGLPAGAYFCRIGEGASEMTAKFVVRH